MLTVNDERVVQRYEDKFVTNESRLKLVTNYRKSATNYYTIFCIRDGDQRLNYFFANASRTRLFDGKMCETNVKQHSSKATLTDGQLCFFPFVPYHRIPPILHISLSMTMMKRSLHSLFAVVVALTATLTFTTGVVHRQSNPHRHYLEGRFLQNSKSAKNGNAKSNKNGKGKSSKSEQVRATLSLP